VADDRLERPDEIRGPDDQRRDGRPTGAPKDDGTRPGIDHHEAPTDAPEEHGATPTTEHAPGGDL
jgi:hypothetical protein